MRLHIALTALVASPPSFSAAGGGGVVVDAAPVSSFEADSTKTVKEGGVQPGVGIPSHTLRRSAGQHDATAAAADTASDDDDVNIKQPGRSTTKSGGCNLSSNIKPSRTSTLTTAATTVRRVVPPAVPAAAGDGGADVAAAAAAATDGAAAASGPAEDERHVQSSLQEEENVADGMYRYLEEHDGQADVGLFLDSPAAADASTEEKRHRRELTSNCPTDDTWVDCVNGLVRGTSTACGSADACGTGCCVGTNACDGTTACIKKDGSCNGLQACRDTGYSSSYEIQISGPSCVGEEACFGMFRNNPGTGMRSVTDSCLCDYACHQNYFERTFHCARDDPGVTPAPLLGLPACNGNIANVPGRIGSVCSDFCPNDGWVDCLDGYLRSDSSTPCNHATEPDACGNYCCQGSYACDTTTACIKKDGSCNGDYACGFAGSGEYYPINYALQISGPSCTARDACYGIFYNNRNTGPAATGGVVSVTDSCLCEESCYAADPYPRYHCGRNSDYPTPAPLPGLPVCGISFNDVIGRTGYDGCRDPSSAPSTIPSHIPSNVPSESPSILPSTAPSVLPSAAPSSAPSSDPTASRPPSVSPSSNPSSTPSDSPSLAPSSYPTRPPSELPSHVPSRTPSAMPSNIPSTLPSGIPSNDPSDIPSKTPSALPSTSPSVLPSKSPSSNPSSSPSSHPSESPSTMPSSHPSLSPSRHPSVSAAPSAMPSSSPSDAPTNRPTPAPRPPPTRSPTKLPSSHPSGIPSDISAMPSITSSSTPSALSSSNPSATSSTSPSITASSSPSISTSNTVPSVPSAAPTISHSPSALSSSRPSTPPSFAPSSTLSSTPSSQPSVSPSSSPTPECQDFTNFDQNLFNFQDFGMNSVEIIFQGTLAPGDFEGATCDALKDQQEALGVSIVSCCASAEFIPGGRRLQDDNTTTVSSTVVEFTTAIAYSVNTAITDDVWQVAFADAINSDMFGDMIGGTVEDLQQLSSSASEKSMKSSKSAVVSGGSKSSKSASSTGGSNMSSKSMKSTSSSF